ncbi:uncharacterized protein THITE_2119813 [Thermothielavioides terrestris NRRL 8126]|uniref:Selenoprotein W-like protein n=1 Tax=Thermothielavioides terrestris (strain ATCC 38088 / NRRL 8126) TaxID=578455 RepID=G2R8X2_THETT|nr:uncharacterized protein THITE_2119813 [Thermothielavioides terrestris NRRL 8126]AEO69422.1 hypothetical protein THITE_2119813 [Thermothielavioides terrestris NRRL 8126]
MAELAQAAAEPRLPRITIRFCTQCKWMLRAAYYAQELLSTFSTSLGEVALQPGTGGVFVVELTTASTNPTTATTAERAGSDEPDPTAPPSAASAVPVVLWDRKRDGGFPETKELKRRVRDVIQPGRDLGHVDRDYHHPRGRGNGDAAGGEGAVVEEGEREKGEGKASKEEERLEGVVAAGGADKAGKAGEIGGRVVCGVGDRERCEDCE